MRARLRTVCTTKQNILLRLVYGCGRCVSDRGEPGTAFTIPSVALYVTVLLVETGKVVAHGIA